MPRQMSIEAPNKKVYKIEVPDDATEEDAFGYVQHLMEQDAKHAERTGVFPHAAQALNQGKANIYEGASTIAGLAGFPETEASLAEKGKKTKEAAAGMAEPTTPEDVEAAKAKGPVSGAIASLEKNIGEPLGSGVGSIAPTAAMLATGSWPIASVGAGAEYLRDVGHIRELGGTPEASALGGVPVAAINTGTGVGGLLNNAITRKLALQAGEGLATKTAKATATNAIVGGPSAIAAEDISRSAANQPLMNKEEMGETLKDVAITSVPFGAAHAVASHLATPKTNPLMPDYLAEKAKAQEPAPVQDNIPEPTVKGKQAATEQTDLGVVHDVDSLTRNFDLSKMPKSYNLWNVRNKSGDGFRSYGSLEESVTGINDLLKAYKHLHQIDTPIDLTNRYAPKKDHNNPEAYAKNIADHLGLDSVNDKIDLDDPAVRNKVIWAIARQEGVVRPNKNVQGKSYTPGEKPVVEGQATAEQPAPAMLTPEQIRDQLGLGEKHPAYSTLKDIDLATDEGLADAESVLNGLKETAGRKESIAEDKVSAVDDILSQLKTKPKVEPNEFEAAQVEVDNLQKAHEADPTPENLNKFSAAKEQLETTKKASQVSKAFDEALGESAQPKVEPVTTETAQPETAQPKTAQPEPARNPLMPDYLAAKGREQEGSISTAESDLLSNPSTVVRDPEGKPTFIKAVKDTAKNSGKNHVDKWLGLTKINEVYGDFVGDQMSAYWTGHELDNIGRIIPRALEKGGLKKMPDGRIEVVELPIEMHDGSTKNASIRNMLDLVKNEKDGQDILNEILWVTNEKRMLEKNPKNASLRATRDPEGFAKKVQNVDTILKSKPVYQDALSMLKEVNSARVDFLKDTEQLTDDMYKYFKENELYVPNYMLRDEASDMLGASGKKTTIGNTATRAFRERTPSDHDINPMENIANEFLRSYIGGARNNHKVQTALQLQKIGKATYVGRTNIKDKQGNFGVLKGGKREFYQLHDPTDYPVMEIINQSVNPIMIASRASAGIIRTAATNTPNFWLRQLFIDPLGASMVSDVGWVTPAHTMYQITRALTGNKKILDRLMDAGVVGHIDPRLDPRDARAFYKEVGTRTVSKSGLDKFKGKLRSASEYAHILIDGGTRCAVYEKAYAKGVKKGMSPEKADSYAVMKAREVINFGVSGNAESQRVARQMTPFLGASINAIEVMRRNITMEHVKLEDRAAYRKQFMNKVYTVGMLSAVHALYMAGDPDYEEAMNNFKYSKVAIPTGNKEDPLFGAAIPPDMAFLYYIPALVAQYATGTKDSHEVWKIIKDQALTMIPGGVGYTGVPVPQIAKPILELVTDRSFFTGQDIVPKAEQGLPPWAQGQYTASKTSKAVGRMFDISPPRLDAFIKGYLGSFGDIALWAVDGMLDATGLADNIQKPDKHWTQTPGLGLQSSFGTYLASQSVEDMYAHKEKADKARKLYNQLGSQGPAGQEDFKNFTSDPENIKLAQLATVLDRYAKKESDIMKQIHTLQSSDISSAEMTRRIKEEKEKRNKVAQEAEKLYASVMGKGMAKGGLVDKIKAQHFGPKDSTIISSLMHPQEATARAGDWLQEKMRIASSNPYEEFTPDEQAQAGLDIAGLANTGAMPFSPMTGKGTLGMFAGLKSSTADLGAHEAAQAMETAGKSPEEILKATGWFKGSDGGWRYEISDAGAKLKAPIGDIPEGSKEHTLGNMYEHPELFKAYPELANKRLINLGSSEKSGLLGERSADHIGLAANLDNPLNILSHELQHDVQHKEGFETGSSPYDMNRDILMRDQAHRYDTLAAAARGAMEQYHSLPEGSPERDSVRQLVGSIRDEQHRIKSMSLDDLAIEKYKRLMAETEARNTEGRLAMDSASRSNTPPWVTQEYTNAQQISKASANLDPYESRSPHEKLEYPFIQKYMAKTLGKK